MNPSYHYQPRQPGPPLPPVPPYYPMMNNYGNNASATASPDSGIYCPQENPNLISDQHPPTPSLAVSPYYNHNEGYHPYPQYPHQYHNQQQIPNNNFPVYRNPAINFQPPIPGNSNAILEGNSSRNRNETNSFVGQDGGMTGTTTTQGERLSISDNNEGNIRPVKVILGRVTSRDGDVGVIDEDIFFHISAVVKGTEVPQIGDNVLVKAEATRIPGYKWYAKEVQLVKIGLNQEDHQKNLPPVPPPAPKISKNTSSASEKSNSTKSRHKSDRDYSYNRRRRSSSRDRPRSGRSSRNSRKRDSEVTKSSEPKKRKFHNDEDNSESISNEKTETFVKTNEELNISQNIHATTEETSAISSEDPAEPQIETESEKSKDKEGSGSVEYANAVSENSEVGVDNCEKSVSSEQTPIQIPDGLANVENATKNPTDTEQDLSAVSSPNTQVKHAFHGIQIKKEKVDPILPKNLVTPDKTLSPPASQTLTIDNTRIKQEPPEETPKSPNPNKYSTILLTSLPNNHPIILPVEIDKVKEEPLEDASTELDEDSPANDSFLVDKTPIYTGPSASTAIVNPIHRNNNIESVSLIPNSLYFGIPPVESEIQDQERDSDQRDEMLTEISDCLISGFVPFPDENVSASLNSENADLSVESVSNEGKEISEEGNANSEGTDLGKYDIGISNTDEPEITNDQETLRKTSESHDHSESETEIAEPENQNCFTSTLCGRPVQTLSPAQVLLNRIRKVRSGVNVKPKIQREKTTTRKDPTDKNEIVNESTTNDYLINVVANDPLTSGLAVKFGDETVSDCLHVKSVELPMEDCLSIVNLLNANNPDNCINATDILDTPDEISNIGDREKPGQILNPSTENNEQNLNCQESLATSNPIAPTSLVNPLAINLNEAQVKEFGEIVRTISAKSVSEPGTSQGGKGPTKKSESPKQKQTFTAAEYANMKAKRKRPRVYGPEPRDEYANQSGEFFYGTVGHGPNYPNTGNGRWFDYYEAFMADNDSRRFNPRVDFSFNGIDSTFNQPREPWVPPQQFIPPLMNNAPIRPGIGICQFCGEMGHHESVCRHRSSRVEFHSQEPPIMRVGDAPICQVCGKRGHETNVCWHHLRNAKSDFGVEPPLASCSFCRIKGHDVSVCRNLLKRNKCKICKKIGHHESVCRSRFRV